MSLTRETFSTYFQTYDKLIRLKRMYFFFEAMSTNYFDTPFVFTNTAKLNKLSDFGECQLASQLIMSNALSRLNSLDLDFFFSVQFVGQRGTVPLLKNMPVLQHLKLKDATLTVLDLEVLHVNLPSIKSLNLDWFGLHTGDMPQDVVPASALTKIELGLNWVSDLSTHIQFYTYVGRKYNTIENPVYIDYIVDEGNMVYAMEVYNKGMLPLYQKIGSQVDYFEFTNYPNGMDFFRKFDQFKMRLKRLTMDSFKEKPIFMEELVQSQQSKYLQKLTLSDMIPTPLNRLINMEVLETLYIDCDRSYDCTTDDTRKMDFNQLLMACPATLTTLYIEGVDLTFNGSPPSNTTSIKHLTLKHVGLTSALAKRIESCFPKLATLSLQDSLTANVTISLRDCHLESVNIILEYEEDSGKNQFSTETACVGSISYHTITHTQRKNIFTRLLTNSFALKVIHPTVKKLVFSTQHKYYR